MTTEQGAPDIGELALADAALGMVIAELVAGLTQSELRDDLTTRQAARRLELLAQDEPGLFAPGVHEWIEEVRAKTDQRNAIMHARAADRCIGCGSATHYVHRGVAVDRSPERVAELTAEIGRLARHGVELSRKAGRRFNERELARARARAAAESTVQTPPQVYFEPTTNQCAQCSPSGNRTTTVSVGTAVAVLPPGTDMRALALRLGATVGDEQPDAN